MAQYCNTKAIPQIKTSYCVQNTTHKNVVCCESCNPEETDGQFLQKQGIIGKIKKTKSKAHITEITGIKFEIFRAVKT